MSWLTLLFNLAVILAILALSYYVECRMNTETESVNHRMNKLLLVQQEQAQMLRMLVSEGFGGGGGGEYQQHWPYEGPGNGHDHSGEHHHNHDDLQRSPDELTMDMVAANESLKIIPVDDDDDLSIYSMDSASGELDYVSDDDGEDNYSTTSSNTDYSDTTAASDDDDDCDIQFTDGLMMNVLFAAGNASPETGKFTQPITEAEIVSESVADDMAVTELDGVDEVLPELLVDTDAAVDEEPVLMIAAPLATATPQPVTREFLEAMTLKEMQQYARQSHGHVRGVGKLNKVELVQAILNGPKAGVAAAIVL